MFSLEEIVRITGGRPVGALAGEVSGIATDSRTIKSGELFVPLKGERYDGHDFLLQSDGGQITAALCSTAWLRQHRLPERIAGIAVTDTLRALGDLAAAWRRRFALTVIGVTGSNGKTTTKEMLAAILGLVDQGLKTSGNLNNLIGLPAMIFQLRPEHCWAVLEMGMSEPGEIDRLAEISDPAVGIVLNAMPAHLKTMGSVDAVARAKGELLHRIQDGGLAVVNADDPRIVSLSQNPSAGRISFGIKRGEVRAEDIRTLGDAGQCFTLNTPLGRREVALQALGRHSIYNALAAAAALLERTGLETIVEGLAAFTPYSGRFKPEQLPDGRLLIDDSYNANPASCAAALATVQEIRGGRAVTVVLGDMLELGTQEHDLHRELGRQAAAVADRLCLLGPLSVEAAAGAREAGMDPAAVMHATDHDQVIQAVLPADRGDELILVKGSRGMRMEKIAAALRAAGRQED